MAAMPWTWSQKIFTVAIMGTASRAPGMPHNHPQKRTDDNASRTVELKQGGLKEAILGNTQSVVVGGALVCTLLFFLLAGGAYGSFRNH